MARDFVEQVYIPDLLAIASFYKDWAGIGGGLGNYLTYGDFPRKTIDRPDEFWIPRGVVLNKNLGAPPAAMEQERIAEYVTHSWYTYAGGDEQGKHPWQGETSPRYTGPKPPYEYLDTDAKYSWLKAPRYDDTPMEVGPLARMIVSYAAGHPDVRATVDGVLQKLGVGPAALFSTLGRVAARGIETLLMTRELDRWIDELAANMTRGDLAIHNGERWRPQTWPKEAEGWGFMEAPRGALGHWVRIKNGKIENYQAVVPSTWNGSPRDARGQPGAYEASLIDTPVADPEQPLEILRTIHSFDPCLACAVHVLNANGRELTRIQVV